MKKTIAMMMLLGGGLLAAPHISAGTGFGAPAPVVAARPACPGPGYTWVDGYYSPDGAWTSGYGAAPAGLRENVRRHDRDHDFRERGVHFDRDHGRR